MYTFTSRGEIFDRLEDDGGDLASILRARVPEPARFYWIVKPRARERRLYISIVTFHFLFLYQKRDVIKS